MIHHNRHSTASLTASQADIDTLANAAEKELLADPAFVRRAAVLAERIRNWRYFRADSNIFSSRLYGAWRSILDLHALVDWIAGNQDYRPSWGPINHDTLDEIERRVDIILARW